MMNVKKIDLTPSLPYARSARTSPIFQSAMKVEVYKVYIQF